jgi:hypothetical protein
VLIMTHYFYSDPRPQGKGYNEFDTLADYVFRVIISSVIAVAESLTPGDRAPKLRLC